MKKRLSFISNSSSQSFIINPKDISIKEVKEYLYKILIEAGYNKKDIDDNVNIFHYKDVLKIKNGKWINDDLHSWYDKIKKEEYKWKKWFVKIKSSDIIVYMSDNFWPYDSKTNDWYKINEVLKKFNIKNLHKWAMHMG